MDQRPRRLVRSLLAACTALMVQAAAAQDAVVAWRDAGTVRWHGLSSGQARLPERIPLGSVWKLFVYAYLADTGKDEPAYRCAARSTARGEDEYCCEPGAWVERDDALARSCAPYFAPTRLGIAAADWRRYWQERGDPDAEWLADLDKLKADTRVAPAQLLAALDAVSPPARRRAREALLAVLLQGYGRDAWPETGTGLRFKTFSWHDEHGRNIGGGAGWTSDGTAFWFAAAGASRNAIERHGAALAQGLPAPDTDADEGDAPCVDVHFFARYPIASVRDAQGRAVPGGSLAGPVEVRFENGSRLTLYPRRTLDLDHEGGRPVIRGRFTIEDYVARVIDREGSAAQPQAARALAVAARSYLVQQANFANGCRSIADDSRRQRVSPNPPSAAARAAARFTEGLVLQTPVRYHRDKAAPQVMSWRRAEALAASGQRFDAILADAFSPAAFGGIGHGTDCARLADAEAWLAGRGVTWARALRPEPGFETPERITVCALGTGHPYADEGRNRIYVRDWMSAQGRLALAHEYVHLAFRFHPSGEDEDFVERTARRLDAGALP
ncbi:DUF2300 domain-containing protein [Azonexus sp.]|uniref:DUF2300 domain-containing protein n=1 Tax=Azonexus sp. TaxID=1872668 RepID=UPI0035ADA195